MQSILDFSAKTLAKNMVMTIKTLKNMYAVLRGVKSGLFFKAVSPLYLM